MIWKRRTIICLRFMYFPLDHTLMSVFTSSNLFAVLSSLQIILYIFLARCPVFQPFDLHVFSDTLSLNIHIENVFVRYNTE
jgi:hypothetical protein